MITTKIVFDRKKIAGRNGVGSLEVRITSERRSYYIGTGIRVHASEWKADRIVNRPDADVLNDRLAIIFQKVCDETNRCLRDGEPLCADLIRRKVWNEQASMSNDPVFLDWLGHQIDMLTLADGTIRHYRTLLTRLHEFGRIRHWHDVTTENISELDAWLHRRRAGSGEPITDAAVYKYHKCLKAMLNRAVVFDKLDRNPYDRLKFKRGESENIEYLTEDEMQAIMSLDIPHGTQMEVVRDLFVFQMFTGLAYSDAQAFDFSQYRLVNGRYVNTRERIKSGVPYVSSLLPPAVDVLKRYGWKVPRIDNADYNHILKAVGIMAGIHTKLHTHLARHTFATYMLRQGVKVENLQRMLGHKNIRQTMLYAKVLAQSVHDDYEMVARKMQKK